MAERRLFRWSRDRRRRGFAEKLGEVVVGEIVVGAEVDCLGEPLASCDAVVCAQRRYRSRNLSRASVFSRSDARLIARPAASCRRTEDTAPGMLSSEI